MFKPRCQCSLGAFFQQHRHCHLQPLENQNPELQTIEKNEPLAACEDHLWTASCDGKEGRSEAIGSALDTQAAPAVGLGDVDLYEFECRNLVKKAGVFSDSLDASEYTGFIWPGFLNQVPAL